MELTPHSVFHPSTTKAMPGLVEAQLMRTHNGPGFGFRPLPVELLSEIFQWAVVGRTCTLPWASRPYAGFTISHVCRLWREVALSSPIWNHLHITLEAGTYAETLSQIQTLLARSTRKDLRMVLQQSLLLDGHGPAASIHDIVVPHSLRITELDLSLDIEAIKIFFRLPRGTLAHLVALTLTVGHRIHSDWLLFGDEEEPETTPLSQLAPLLSTFKFNPAYRRNREDCDCTFDPFAIGFDFGRLRHLRLAVNLDSDVALAFLERCVALETATFLLSPFGDNSSLEPSRIEVPALRRLYLRSIGWDGVNSFLYRLNLPALKWYGHQSGEMGRGYSQGGLMNLLQASTIRLNSLHLRNIRGFLGVELTEILRDQHTLTRLELTGCRGTFWQALETGHFLVPYLTEFTFTDFTELHLPALICFVNARCPGATRASENAPSLPRRKLREPRALEILNLTPKFPLTDRGEPFLAGSPGHRMQTAVIDWRQCGIKVTLDTLESTDWEEKKTCPKMDGLVSPLHSDSADEVDFESDLEEEEEEEEAAEDGPAESDSSEGDVASDAELGPDDHLEEEGWDEE
ncbi:hypothetical protein DFH06DRAFT_1485135 [Mycena polygramma]|nr:hypothetical protein DFH06DRAFT_1485135 [Mycena polygramma]